MDKSQVMLAQMARDSTDVLCLRKQQKSDLSTPTRKTADIAQWILDSVQSLMQKRQELEAARLC